MSSNPTVDVSNQKLTMLPEFIPNLTHLFCDKNQLTTIPLLSNLIVLYCDKNQLTTIPLLPNLTHLFCDKNQLTTIPLLPNLTNLWCRNNQLTSLPLLPNLKCLKCDTNPLPYTEINGYKNTMEIFNRCKEIIYAKKLRNQFRNWLWDKVRRPKIEAKYHPSKIMERINASDNWEDLDDN